MSKDMDRLLADNTWRFWLSLSDNGGRRSGLDRRLFSSSKHIPERRSGNDRRARIDRRQGIDGVIRAGRRLDVRQITGSHES